MVSLEEQDCVSNGFVWCAAAARCITKFGPDDNMEMCSSAPAGDTSELRVFGIEQWAVQICAAVVAVVVVNELAKLALVSRSRKLLAAQEKEAVIVSAAVLQNWGGKQSEHSAVADEARRLRQEQDRQKTLERMATARKRYGVRVVMPGEVKTIGEGELDEEGARAKLVAEQELAAPEREELLRRQALREKDAKLAKIERQRKAYGLFGPGQRVGLAAPQPRPQTTEWSLAEQQDAEYAAGLHADEAVQQRARDEARAHRARVVELEAKFAQQPKRGEGVAELLIELPSGRRASRRFTMVTTCATLFSYVRLLLLRGGDDPGAAEGGKELLHEGFALGINFGPPIADSDQTLEGAGISRREKIIVKEVEKRN